LSRSLFFFFLTDRCSPPLSPPVSPSVVVSFTESRSFFLFSFAPSLLTIGHNLCSPTLLPPTSPSAAITAHAPSFQPSPKSINLNVVTSFTKSRGFFSSLHASTRASAHDSTRAFAHDSVRAFDSLTLLPSFYLFCFFLIWVYSKDD